MNLKILTWILVGAIILLALADGWLVISGLNSGAILEKTVNSKVKEFNRKVLLEREKIRQEINENYKSGLDLYSDLAKKMEAEKKRIKELEGSLGRKDKK